MLVPKIAAGERYRKTDIDDDEEYEEARKGIFRAGNEVRMIRRDRMAIAPENMSLLVFGGSCCYVLEGYIGRTVAGLPDRYGA